MERNYYKGNGAAQLLKRFNAKAITELMCHTTAAPKHALLSSTRVQNLSEPSVGESEIGLNERQPAFVTLMCTTGWLPTLALFHTLTVRRGADGLEGTHTDPD